MYGVDAAYPINLTLAALAGMNNPAPQWVLVYVGGPTNGGHWTVGDKQSVASRYRTIPCYVGQNDLQRADGSIYHIGTYTAPQGEADALDALSCFAEYGYLSGTYWLDTEYITYANSGAQVLDYIDAFHKTMYARGWLPGQYGSKQMLEDYRPSVPCGAAVAQWFDLNPTPAPNILDIPLSSDARNRYAWLAWQYVNRGGYDASVSDERMFPSADWNIAPNKPNGTQDDKPGTVYKLSDGTDARYFSETGYSIAHGFKSFWEKYGSPEAGFLLFGYPISREYVRLFPNGEAFTCQMFERARFEWHPSSNAGRFDVELGLIGNLVLERTNEAMTYPAAFVKENPPT
jgi:hypothetical protein